MARKSWFDLDRLRRSPPETREHAQGDVRPDPEADVDGLSQDEKGADPALPHTVSHYRILERLGTGGMGVVVKAEDTRLGRTVALKFLHEHAPDDAHAIERMWIEARAASALNHPNICTVHDVGQWEGRTFIVMEYLEGLTLRRLLRRGALPPLRALDLGTQLADGLDAAHTEGIVHRDIKPENVLVGPHDRLKILDFGVAKLQVPTRHPGRAPSATDAATHEAERQLTRPGEALGTLAYMSPEQARGEDVDARTDVFSLGAVLYEMVSGQRAFPGRTAADVYAAILAHMPALPDGVGTDLRAGLQPLLDRTLQKNPELRAQHASDVAADLKRLKRDLDVRREAGPPGRRPPTEREPRLGWKVAGDLVKAAVLAALLAGLHQSIETRPAGRYLRQFQMALAQDNAWRGRRDEVDFEAGGRHLPLIVDISALHADKRRPTDRVTLDLLIDTVRRHGARAVGVDLSFDDLAGGDFRYLDKWRRHGNVRVGIYRRAVEQRDAWLGRPEFAGLAAGIAVPADDPQRAYFYSRRWFLAAPGRDTGHGGRDCAEPGPDADGCREDLIQLPAAMWLISERQRIASEEPSLHDRLEARLKHSLEALQPRTVERSIGSALEFGTYVIDYSYLRELRRDIITPSPGPAGEVSVALSQLDAQAARLTDRVVLIGDLEDTNDQLCYTPGMKPLSGVLIHACSLATLNRGMLFEVANSLSATTLWWAVSALVALVVGLRIAHARVAGLTAWPYQYLEIVVFGALSLAVLAGFRWQTRAGGILWPHFIWVCAGLGLHPFTEPVYRAVTAVPAMAHGLLSGRDGRANGG